MRLWHKELIPALPSKQLLGQWREIFAILSDYQREKNGIGKKSAYANRHPLVKYVNDVDLIHLKSFAKLVSDEMIRRGYSPNESLLDEVAVQNPLSLQDIFPDEHNQEYYEICFYNLLEKHRFGLISDKEWAVLVDSRKHRNETD